VIQEELVLEFKRIYESVFSESISMDDARIKAESLLIVIRIILQPMTEERVLLHWARSSQDHKSNP